MATQREMYHGNELYAWRENAANRTRAIDVDKWAQNQADILHLPGAQGEKKLSILDNVISPSSAFVQVDTEGGAPADDLASITPGDLHSGMLLYLVAADSERVVTLRNSADATGIQTVDGKDVDLDTQYSIVLRLVSTDALTYWQEIPGPLRAKTQPATSKDSLGLMQVGQHLEVTPEGVVDAPLASEAKQGMGRSATTAEVESGVTGENGPAWVTPENLVLALSFMDKYELCEPYYFRHPTLKPGFQPAQGGVVTNAATLYPKAWAYLQTTEGQKLCTTEEEWQAMTTAIWHTNADGTTVGWNGIGGAPFYVQDLNAGTLRLPDLRGMVAEAAGFDSLRAGGVHGDMMRKIEGTIGYASNGHWVQGKTSKAFAITYTPNMGSSLMLDDITRDYTASFNSGRVGPVGAANKSRAWGALACVYLGAPK